LALASFVALVGWRVWLTASYRAGIYDSADAVPARRVAIVFGAGVRGEHPSPALASRIEAAADLYHAGKVRKLLMTGDNRFIDYSEPGAMRAYAIQLGVPTRDIVLDYAGRRTYDSCYRARAIFGVEEAVLVSQGFHLARSLYLCEHLGVTAVGLIADRRSWPVVLRLQWEVRETFASAAAWWDINVARPLPVLGEPIPIEG
jgi:SanA protein